MPISIAGYDIQRRVGSGGMAAVYLAVQQNFDRQVAIKVLSPQQHDEKAYAERFLSEAKMVAGLNHPHIIPVYDVGRVDDHYYIAMEYLPGNTLSHWITTGLLEQEAVKVLCEIADALDYAHSKGVIHRDIKPDNIMFRENYSAVLTDFGIARSSKQDTGLTREGVMIGTPRYMSPEQARGLTLDQRSDIYSLGAVFYQMLTGRPPYDAPDPMAMALAQVNEPVPVLPDQYACYQTLLEQMMAKDVAQRFASCRAIIKGVEALSKQAAEPQRASRPQSDNEASQVQALSLVESDQAASARAVDRDAGRGVLPVPDKSLGCETVMRRKALLFSQSVMKADIVSDDAGQFGIRFGRVSEQLLLWHEKFGKKAGRLELRVFIRPGLVELVEEAVRRLCQTRPLYAFLDKVTIDLMICDLDGNILVHYPSFSGDG